MKKIFIIFFIFLFSIPFANAYSENISLAECLKNAGSNYFKQYDCINAVNAHYIKENKQLLKELKTKLSYSSYQKILVNQSLLDEYVNYLNNGELKILNNTNGIMYQTIAKETLLSLNQTNNDILNLLNSSKYQITENQNKILLNQANNRLQQYLSDVKKHYSKEQYTSVKQSQTTWGKYRDDTFNRILPLINSSQLIKHHIKLSIWENRINTVFNTNIPKYELEGFPN